MPASAVVVPIDRRSYAKSFQEVAVITDPRLRIAVARRILAREGCTSGVAGHVSERAAGEDAFYVSPFEYFDETVPERVIKVSFDLELLAGDWEPSPAIEFHASLYRARTDVNAIVHTHAHHSAVLSTVGKPLGMYNDVSCLFFDEQALLDEADASAIVMGDHLVEAAGVDKHVVLLKNHGVVILGESLEVATVEAFSFEEAARIHIEATMIGGTEHTADYAMAKKRGYHRAWRDEMWRASVRRLHRDQPELFVSQEAPMRSASSRS